MVYGGAAAATEELTALYQKVCKSFQAWAYQADFS